MTAPATAPAAAATRRRWCRGTRLLVAGSVLWLGFVLAQRALSGRWWPWLVVDMVPPLAFAVIPVLPVLVLLGSLRLGVPVPVAARWWVVAASVLALLLGLDRSGLNAAALRGGADGPAPAGALRVVSWNTQYWHQDDDPDRFYRYLRAQDADVYLLQEYLGHRDDEFDPRLANLPARDLDRLRREFPGHTVVARGELVTVSRLPVLARPAVGPDRVAAADWFTEFERAKVLRTDLLADGRVLSFYNVHIPVHADVRLSPLSADFYRYVREAAALREEQFAGLHADLAANPNPVLVAGDLNAGPSMGELDRLRTSTVDAVRANDSVLPTSWSAAGGLLGWRLDWAFTAGGLRVHSYDFVDHQGLSDHRLQRLVTSSR